MAFEGDGAASVLSAPDEDAAAALAVSAHGGPDAWGVPLHDFSTNANAAGPCPQARAAVRRSDARHYPEPTYAALRAQLAALHGVAPQQVVLAASASEAMFRFAAAARQLGLRTTWLPPAHYLDAARASAASHLCRVAEPQQAQLRWACEPSTPAGGPQEGLAALLPEPGQAEAGAVVLLDCAYEPLRLAGAPSLTPAQQRRVWRLISPNKALGLTGVRAAYLLAPEEAPPTAVLPSGPTVADWLAALALLAPSWPVGAHGVAMLAAWCTPEVQAWLARSRQRLARWKAQQTHAMQAVGWTVQPSEANFMLARPPEAWLAQTGLDALLMHWRARLGVKLRDARSFGHPGWVRVAVRPPTRPCIWMQMLPP